MFFLHPAAWLWSACYFHCLQWNCSRLSVLLNQGLNILKTCISKTCICSRLILPSKLHGMLNLKPLFRPINVNLKCFAESTIIFQRTWPLLLWTSLKMDWEGQATSSIQQPRQVSSAGGCSPRITPVSCWSCLHQNVSRAGRRCYRWWGRRGGILRWVGSFPLAASLPLSAGFASEIPLPASTPAFRTMSFNLALL